MTAQTDRDGQLAALAALLSGDFDSYERLSLPLEGDPAWATFPHLMDAAFRGAVRELFGPAPTPAAITGFAERMRGTYDLKPPAVFWLLRAATGTPPPRLRRPLTQAEQFDLAATQVVLLYALASEAGLAGPRLEQFLATTQAAVRGTRPPGDPAAAMPAPSEPPPARHRRPGRGVIIMTVAIALVVLGIGPVIALTNILADKLHPLPTAPPNLIAALTASPDEVVTTSGDQVKQLGRAAGAFAGPHFTWQFGLVQVTGTTPESGYSGRLEQAARGDEFIAIYAESGTTAQFRAESDDHVTAVVVVNGSARAVPRDVLTNFAGLLVSVPKGATATLRVTDDGRTQSYDLRAGKRGPDAIPGYYQPHEVDIPSSDAGYTGVGTCPDVPYIQNVTLPCSARIQFLLDTDSFSLQPWLPALGWAQGGRMWLLITNVAYLPDGTPVTIAPGGGSFTPEASKTFTVQLPDGTSIGVMPQTAATFDTTQPAALAFSVPAGFTRGTLLVHPDGKLIVTGEPAHWATPPPLKRIPLTVPR